MAGKKKATFIVTSAGKSIAVLIIAVILVMAVLSTIIYAHLSYNPIKGKNIIIDPGHGGIDPGTNDNSYFFEKDINLQIAAKLDKKLEGYGAYVDLTRESDIALDHLNNSGNTRHKRDLMARVAMFNSGQYGLFISLHVNRSSNERALGPIVLYSSKIPQSRYLAECLQNRLNQHIKQQFNKNTERKPVASNYYILKNSSISGVIVETGFISNTEDKRLLQEDSYQEKLVHAIHLGIKDYYNKIENLSKDELERDVPTDQEDGVPFTITNEIRQVCK